MDPCTSHPQARCLQRCLDRRARHRSQHPAPRAQQQGGGFTCYLQDSPGIDRFTAAPGQRGPVPNRGSGAGRSRPAGSALPRSAGLPITFGVRELELQTHAGPRQVGAQHTAGRLQHWRLARAPSRMFGWDQSGRVRKVRIRSSGGDQSERPDSRDASRPAVDYVAHFDVPGSPGTAGNIPEGAGARLLIGEVVGHRNVVQGLSQTATCCSTRMTRIAGSPFPRIIGAAACRPARRPRAPAPICRASQTLHCGQSPPTSPLRLDLQPLCSPACQPPTLKVPYDDQPAGREGASATGHRTNPGAEPLSRRRVCAGRSRGDTTGPVGPTPSRRRRPYRMSRSRSCRCAPCRPGRSTSPVPASAIRRPRRRR